MTATPVTIPSRRGVLLGAGALAALAVLKPLAAAASDTPEPVSLDAHRRSALAALPPLYGPSFGPDDLAGKIVVLTFFASWCPPCHPEFDYLKQIDAAYRDLGVRVVAVNIFEDYLKPTEARLRGFLAAKDPAFAVLGAGERVGPLFNDVKRIPTLYVFAPDGRPVTHFVHLRGAKKTHASFEEIEAAVKAAL